MFVLRFALSVDLDAVYFDAGVRAYQSAAAATDAGFRIRHICEVVASVVHFKRLKRKCIGRTRYHT